MLSPLPVVSVHLTQPNLVDPVRQTISEYALAPRAEGSFALSAMLLMAGSVMVLVELVGLGLRPGSWPMVLLVTWCVALPVLVMFKTNPGTEMTVSGMIHRYAAVLLVASMPAAMLGLGRSLRASLASAARWLTTLGWISLGVLVALVVWQVPVLFPATAADMPVLNGLIQRVAMGADIAAMAVLAIVLLRRTAPVPRARTALTAPVSAARREPLPASGRSIG